MIRRSLAVVVLTSGLLAGTTASPVRAVGSGGPTIALTAAGAPITTATDGTPFTSTASAPITINGQTSQVITKTWNRDRLRFVDGSVVAPEGWDVEYTTDGSNWTRTIPTDRTTISGVRTTGSLRSIGYSNGFQTSITSAPSTIKQATVGSLSITGGGDGYDVFMDEQYTKIFNVWHHSSPNQIDCHSLFTGLRCAGYPVTMPLSLGTNDRSTGIAVGTKVWIAAGYGSNPGGGFVCVKISGGLCTNSFVSLTTNVNSAAHSNVGNMERIGQYLFTQNFKDGKVLCLDTATESACAQMPAGGFALGTGPTQSYPSTLTAIGTRLYSNDGNYKVGCLDTSTWARCSGWSSPWTTTKRFNTFALPDSAGSIVALCIFGVNDAECVDSSKSAYSVPASLNSARNTVPLAWWANYNALGGYESAPRTAGSRLYWVNMIWDETMSGGQIGCWDASTNSICTFSGQNYIGDAAYSLSIDPQNADCLWTNDNNGNIESFDALTGNAGCPVPTDAVVQIPYNVSVPRYSCTESGRIRQWDSITISATGISPSTMKLTVKRNGLTLNGWSAIQADSNGRVDLSGLSVNASGTQPMFEITAPGLTNTQAQTIIGDVKYLSDAPQLCVDISPLVYCPVSTGLASSSVLSRPADSINLTVVNSAGATAQNFSVAESVGRTAVPNCLGNLNGNASVSTGSGPVPIPNATIQLKDSAGNVVATATTDGSGNYSFPDAYPHAYTVHFAGSSQAAIVVAGATTTRDFLLSSSNISASPDTKSGTVDQTLTLTATADAGVIPILQGSVQIRDPLTNQFARSMTMAGVGTFTAGTTDNTIDFVPTIGWTGVRTVTYRIADVTNGTATSTLTVMLSPKPVPRAVMRNGRNGATITWSDSPTPSVVSYVVRLGGRIICTTPDATRTCTYPRFVGRSSDFTITAVGGDGTTSTETHAVKTSECAIVGSILFATDKAVVTARADATLRSVAQRMRKVGSSGICIVGHTDSRSTFVSNDDLSYWRATNAWSHISKWLPSNVSATLDYAGEHRPRATNRTARGMQLNRRVDIGVRN